jgi:hypothetical protein
MSPWFISPWEAVRVSLEAQRLIVLQFFPFAPRQEQRRQEAALSDDKSAFVTAQNIGSSAHVAIPSQSKNTLQGRTVAATNATEVIRKTRKTKEAKGRRKSNGTRKRT